MRNHYTCLHRTDIHYFRQLSDARISFCSTQAPYTELYTDNLDKLSFKNLQRMSLIRESTSMYVCRRTREREKKRKAEMIPWTQKFPR